MKKSINLFLYLDHIHFENVYKQNDEQEKIFQHPEIQVMLFVYDDASNFFRFFFKSQIKISEF